MNKIKECKCEFAPIIVTSMTAKKGICAKCKGAVDFSKMKTVGESKYHNKKTVVDNIEFHSGKEAERYKQLLLFEKAKEIKDLKRQVKFPILIEGIKICDWLADFVYTDLKTEEEIVEDAKGCRTDIYKLKKKLVEAYYNIKILET